MKKNYLGTIIGSAILIFLIVFGALLGLKVAAIYAPDQIRQGQLSDIASLVIGIGGGAWSFFRPFLQLIIVLVIVDWILGKFGVSLTDRATRLEWNIQTLIALIVVGAFSIAALADISNVGALKDLALVVVGFYFGTQKKSINLQTDKGEVTVLEEHENRLSVAKESDEEK